MINLDTLYLIIVDNRIKLPLVQQSVLFGIRFPLVKTVQKVSL